MTTAPILPQEAQGRMITVKVSNYWPKLGGVNCSNFVNGACVSRMASGLPWQDYINSAAACPPEWPFHTQVMVNGQVWECLDRGGKIQIVDGVAWIDLLQEHADYPFGTLINAEVIFP